MESMSRSVMRSEPRKAELGLPLIVIVINFQPFLTNRLLSEYSLIPMSYPLGYKPKVGSDLGGVKVWNQYQNCSHRGWGSLP